MAQSVQNANSGESSSGTSRSLSLTLGDGTNRKVTILIGTEQNDGTETLSSVAYNAVSAGAAIVDQAIGTTQRMWLYVVDVPDATGTGSYNITFTCAHASTKFTTYGVQSVNSATGAPEDNDAGTTAAGASTVVSGAGMTNTAGALIIVGVLDQYPVATWNSYSAGVTERTENNEADYTTAEADGVQAGAGAYTPTATSSSDVGGKVLVAVSIAEAGAASMMLLRRRRDN